MATAPARAIEQSEAGSVRSADAYADTAAAPALRKPSAAVRSFLTDSQCVAVTLSDTGRVGVSTDPFRPMSGRLARVWWVHNAASALAIKDQCLAENSSDIAGIARQLRIPLVPNDTAIANAEAAICRMDALLAAAKQHGLLTMLNTRYRIERTRARQAGKSFPPYGTVHRRFRSALLRIAVGQVPTRALVEIALGIEPT